MLSTRVPQRLFERGIWVLLIVIVAAVGIAVGRWVFPGEGAASSASLGTSDSSSVISESVRPDASAEGHVIGVRFEPPGPLSADARVAPESPAEGHVVGVRFK